MGGYCNVAVIVLLKLKQTQYSLYTRTHIKDTCVNWQYVCIYTYIKKCIWSNYRVGPYWSCQCIYSMTCINIFSDCILYEISMNVTVEFISDISLVDMQLFFSSIRIIFKFIFTCSRLACALGPYFDLLTC